MSNINADRLETNDFAKPSRPKRINRNVSPISALDFILRCLVADGAVRHFVDSNAASR